MSRPWQQMLLRARALTADLRQNQTTWSSFGFPSEGRLQHNLVRKKFEEKRPFYIFSKFTTLLFNQQLTFFYFGNMFCEEKWPLC